MKFELLLIFAVNILSAQQKGLFKDPINGRVYKTVKIGEQVWMVDEQSPLKKFLFDDVPQLGDVTEFYKQSNGMMKRNILRCIFSEKIYFDEKKDTTIKFTKPVELMFQIFNELENPETKKEVEIDLFKQFAPLTDERCSYNVMIELLTIRKLKG